MRPDFKAWPQLRRAIVRHSVLGAGDVLFVPEGWGLQAVSLEGSCMVASTYVDEHNVGRAEVSTGGPPDSEGGAIGPGLQARMDPATLYHAVVLPLVSRQDATCHAKLEIERMPLRDHLRSDALEAAAVSAAACGHVWRLQQAGLAPEDMCDSMPVPLLWVAVHANYVALAAWLLELGVPVPRGAEAQALLDSCRLRGMHSMEDVLAAAQRQ